MNLQEIGLLKIGNTIQMAGVIYVGEGQLLLCFFPEDYGFIPGKPVFSPGGNFGDPLEVVDVKMDSADWETFLRQTDIMETEVLTQASDGTLAKAILRKSQRQIDQVVSWRVFKRDEYRCRYCGNDNVPLTVDHLVRWEDGGPSIEANLVAACKKCNRVRGDISYDLWLVHPHYRRVSAGVSKEFQRANEALVATLAGIPRLIHKRSR